MQRARRRAAVPAQPHPTDHDIAAAFRLRPVPLQNDRENTLLAARAGKRPTRDSLTCCLARILADLFSFLTGLLAAKCAPGTAGVVLDNLSPHFLREKG